MAIDEGRSCSWVLVCSGGLVQALGLAQASQVIWKIFFSGAFKQCILMPFCNVLCCAGALYAKLVTIVLDRIARLPGGPLSSPSHQAACCPCD